MQAVLAFVSYHVTMGLKLTNEKEPQNIFWYKQKLGRSVSLSILTGRVVQVTSALGHAELLGHPDLIKHRRQVDKRRGERF